MFLEKLNFLEQNDNFFIRQCLVITIRLEQSESKFYYLSNNKSNHMSWVQDKLNIVSSIIWGEYLLIPLMVIVGVYLTIGLRAMPWLKIPLAFQTL